MAKHIPKEGAHPLNTRKFAQLNDSLSWIHRLLDAHQQGWTPSAESLREWAERVPRHIQLADAQAAQATESELETLEKLLHCLRVSCTLVERQMGMLRGSVQAFRADAKADQKRTESGNCCDSLQLQAPPSGLS